MRYTFTGKNISVSDSTKDKIMQKIDRIHKLFPDEVDVYVTLSSVKNNFTVEVTIPVRKRMLRAEVTAPEMFIAIDEVVDILERQMVKYKRQLQNRSGRDIRFAEEFNYVWPETMGRTEEDEGIHIAKTKRFALKPMDAEEAVMEMELLHHNFYVFKNGETDEVNVVYRRKNGSYGIIEPEY